ncbi:MAG: filamentous hemagglutinin N-terminal protein, partial [Hyphomicrobiales bacterium]|nr:filamentous hemagglutinin N-terminal protein [Hyphomicrobiales bacterium]
NGRPDAPGTGKISLIGGGADGAHVQSGYRQPRARGNDTGADFASPSLHAENGTISVLAGGDVTLTGGSMKGSFVQIGHGGLTSDSTAEILRSDVHVISSGGSVKLGSLGVESAFSKIGHGSYIEVADGADFALGRISGDIHVNALTSVALNGATIPDADKVAENGVADIFLARIGHGAHVQGESPALIVTTGDMSGAITIGAKAGALLAPATPLLLVQLGAAISPTDKDDARQVSSQIGHGSDVRIIPTQIDGSANVTLGGVRPFLDINGVKTAAADITVKADEIALNSIIAGPKNGLDNMQRATIGAGNYVRLQAGAAKAVAVVDTSVTVSGIDPLIDGTTLAAALASDLSLLSAEARGKLANLAAANTTTTAVATPSVTDTPFDVNLFENDLTGNILVSTSAGTGKGVSLLSSITAADIAADGNMAVTRIGHNGFIQLATPHGAAGKAPTLASSIVAPARGGNIDFTEANVLYSTIRVETNNKDDVTATASVTAGLAGAQFNVLAASIGSGSDVMLFTGYGGAGVGAAGAAALSGANGGDIIYRRGTVWDGNYTSSATSTGDDGYDTTITISSQNNINVATTATAGLAGVAENVVLGRVGHGATIAIGSGDGGAGGALGANGGRGGDVRIEQQTPGRDYGVTGAADDLAWGLRGQITLSASDLTATPAVSISSLAAASLAAAANNTVSSRVGHGDHIFVTSGAGGLGGARADDTLVTTAHGGRGGHIVVDFSKRLIESSIVGLIEGELNIQAATTNSLAPSTKNLSEASLGHGDSVQALSGDGGAGGSGLYLTNGVTIASGETTADDFLSNSVFGAASGVGAARGGNGGDISIAFGAIAERNGPVTAFVHDANANIDLTLTGANAASRSLTVSSLISPALANGPGDQVTANIGHNTRFIAVGGLGGAGGAGSASLDRGLLGGEALDATTPRPIQNDASGGRGGDIRIVAGDHTASGAPLGASGAPANTLVIGQVLINADEQVAVTSEAGPGSNSRAHSGVGHLHDVVAMTRSGGTGGSLFGTARDNTSGGNDGIVDSAQKIQIIVYRDGGRGVSLSGSGKADTIQSVAARRTAAPANGSTANPSFFDVDGNPEFILDGAGALVANSVANGALRAAPNNVARFGRVVGAYNPGLVNMERVQYVDIDNDGRPDVVAGVLSSTGSPLTVVDADNNNVYDQIAGRIRLEDGGLAPLGLVDYVHATGRTASTIGDRLDWTYAEFATSNGGRGGDASVTTGATTSLGAGPLVVLNAGKKNAGANPDFSLLVTSTMQATPVSAGSGNVASARVGVSEYLFAATDGSYSGKLAGAYYATVAGAANGMSAGANAVNANGGRGGNANVSAGAITGDVRVNEPVAEALLTRGVKVRAFTDDVTTDNRSLAAIGHGGQYFAHAANVGGNGLSAPASGSLITEAANGGAGGQATIAVGARAGDVIVRAGDVAGGDFSLVIEAVKGGSTAVADAVDTTFANVGHAAIASAKGGSGGTGDDGQYLASGGAGGAARIDIAAVTGAIALDSQTFANAAGGNGVRIESSTSEGQAQAVRAQAGHYGWLTAEGGAGGSGTNQSQIAEQINQIAKGGAGGGASVAHGGFVGGLTIDAGPAKTGDDAIVIKSSDNTVNSGADNFLLAAAGHGVWATASGGGGGLGGQRDSLGGLTLGSDPAFHEGFDIAASNSSNAAPLDRNPIQLGTIRNGGAGGDASIQFGAVTGDIVVRAHDLPGAQKDGVLVSALAGDGANASLASFGNVAIIGHNHNAVASGGSGSDSSFTPLGGTLSRGDGGDGGAGRVAIGAVSGAITVTNASPSDGSLSGGVGDKDIKILAADQDATDSASHRATARVGHRTMADASGGAGGAGALPPPVPLYHAMISAQGGFGGEASIASGALTGDVSITAENSVVLTASGATVSAPTLVAGVGHHAIANSLIAGAGGYGGASATFQDAAMLTALRRYVDLGQSYAALSEMEKLLVAPVLHYYKVAPVYAGQAGPAGALPAAFIARVLAGPSAYVAGTPAAYPLARDNDAVAGTANAVPPVSAEERDSLAALSMASGHGGDARLAQGAIQGAIALQGLGGDAGDAARGVRISTLGVLNAGTQIAHVGHESEIAKAAAGNGQNVRPVTIADGIGGDGGAVSVLQDAVTGAISLTAGSAAANTSGDIAVTSSGVQTSGWQRSLVGNRLTAGDDDPGMRAQPVLRAGGGGGDQDPLASGKLGNGGSIMIDQRNVSGAIALRALGSSPSGTAINIASSANLASGEALTSIGHAMIVDSAKAGDATPYADVDARKDLYGVREGNGGSISLTQWAVSDPLLIEANDKLVVNATTALASGRATVVVGHKQIVADNVYGARAGSIVAGSGADVLSTEDIDVANGAPGFVNAIHANPVQDADGGNVFVSQSAMVADITLRSMREDVEVSAFGVTGRAQTNVGHQRFVAALTGEGGVFAGGTAPRAPSEGGAAIVTRGEVGGDVLIETKAGKTASVMTTSALGSVAEALVGHTVGFSIATGRSGYGEAAFAALDAQLAAYLALPAPSAVPGTAGQATSRDAARVVQQLENVVAAIAFANRYAEHYAPAQQTALATALTNATSALGSARTAQLADVAQSVAAAKAALALANNAVIAGGNPNGIANGADSGAIVYTNDPLVSGDIVVRAGAPAGAGQYLPGGVVAVQADNADGAASLVELGHRHAIANATGVGAGLTAGGPLDGGVAGDGGKIVTSQSTAGDVSLLANRVVVNPTSGLAPADVHLLHRVALSNTTGMADIEGLLGRGGSISAVQTAAGTVNIVANELFSAPTGAADGRLMADGGPGASSLRIGVEASALHQSGSDAMIAGLGGPDNNRGGAISATQTVNSSFNLDLDLNNSGNRADVVIRAEGLGANSVRIGALVVQSARSGDPVDDGSNVTVNQSVGGSIATSGLEDLVVENIGPGATSVLLGHRVSQTADSGETAGLTSQHGGIAQAAQTVSGAIDIAASRSFTQQTDAVSAGRNHIGHEAAQTARSADQRVAGAAADYPVVPGAGTNANYNVVSTQNVSADLSVTSGEILIQSLNGVADGVRLGNVATIAVDTHGEGRVRSTSTLGGDLALVTVAPLAQQKTLLATPVNGDIRILTPDKAGAAQVGHSSTSVVSHDPAAFQPTGVFVTSQSIGDAIAVTSLRNVEVRDGKAGTARIGHTILEASALSATNAVKTSAGDPSTVAQSIDSDIAVTAGNSLGMATVGGVAQIGHYSPASNEWQVTGGRVVTPQTIGGDVTVKAGLNSTAAVVGEAPAVGALGVNNALLDGTAGGEVRIGHTFAPVTGAAANEVQTAAGDVWVEVGAHLHVKTANIGHGPYDFASSAVSKDTAIMGAGSVRNRIVGLTTIGAAQNTKSPQDATTEADVMLFEAANVNSGYGEAGGELRFFIPSRRNLTIVDAPAAASQFNDSTSRADAIAPRSDSTEIVTGAVTHENTFLTMGADRRYVDVGTGNFAFYFEDPVSVSAGGVYLPTDTTHRLEGMSRTCVGGVGGGIGGGAGGGYGRRGLAHASSYDASPAGSGDSCGTDGASSGEGEFTFIPAAERAAPPPRTSGPQARVGTTLVQTAAAPDSVRPAPVQIVIAPAQPPQAAPQPAFMAVPLQTVRISGGRVLSFAASGTNLVATVSGR